MISHSFCFSESGDFAKNSTASTPTYATERIDFSIVTLFVALRNDESGSGAAC